MSPADPLFCNTSLFPDITSNEEPAGILASFTIYTSSLAPPRASIKTSHVIPAVDLFAIVIPITILSNAEDPAPAGTV